MGLNDIGLVALDLLTKILGRTPRFVVLEDNQAIAKILVSGRVPNLCHVQRTRCFACAPARFLVEGAPRFSRLPHAAPSGRRSCEGIHGSGHVGEGAEVHRQCQAWREVLVDPSAIDRCGPTILPLFHVLSWFVSRAVSTAGVLEGTWKYAS